MALGGPAHLCRVVRWFLDGCDVLLDVQHVLDERVHALVEGLVVGQLEAALQQRGLVQQLRQQLRLLAVRVRIVLWSAAGAMSVLAACRMLAVVATQSDMAQQSPTSESHTFKESLTVRGLCIMIGCDCIGCAVLGLQWHTLESTRPLCHGLLRHARKRSGADIEHSCTFSFSSWISGWYGLISSVFWPRMYDCLSESPIACDPCKSATFDVLAGTDLPQASPWPCCM